MDKSEKLKRIWDLVEKYKSALNNGQIKKYTDEEIKIVESLWN